MIESIINGFLAQIVAMFTFHISPWWGYAGIALAANAFAAPASWYFSPLRTPAGILLLVSAAFLAGNWMGEDQAVAPEAPCAEQSSPAPPWQMPFKFPL